MKFNPSIAINTRKGEPMMVDDKTPMTVGWLAVHALDTLNDNCDAKEKRRRFRLATEIQDALERSAVVEIKSDEIDLLDEVVSKSCTTLAYGQFAQAVADMKAPKLAAAE
jgi:hypothetical protein